MTYKHMIHKDNMPAIVAERVKISINFYVAELDATVKRKYVDSPVSMAVSHDISDVVVAGVLDRLKDSGWTVEFDRRDLMAGSNPPVFILS